MQKDVITIQLRLPGLVVLGVEEGERWIEVAVVPGERHLVAFRSRCASTSDEEGT